MNLFEQLPRLAVDVDAGRITSAVRASSNRLVVDGLEVPVTEAERLLPAFTDTHCHLIGPGEMSDRVDLLGVDSRKEVLRRVRSRVDEMEGKSREMWVEGFGWDETLWTDADRITRHELDAISPDRPVALFRVDTHAVAVNTAALAVAGFPESLPEEERKFLPLDAAGEPIGIVAEDAVKRLQTSMPRPDTATMQRWYRIGVDLCRRYGILDVHDMNVQPEWIEPLVRTAESGEMTIRTALFLDGTKPIDSSLLGTEEIAPNLSVAGVKFFLDGALGSRGAHLTRPYADAPETTGLCTMTSDEVIELSRAPLEAGMAVAIHAIGDAAVSSALDAYEVIRPAFPRSVLRIEHAQITRPDDLARFDRLDVLPAVQPIHCTSDIAMASARLGPERLPDAYRWQSFRDIGRPLLAGSDFPVESPDPVAGICAFVERDGGEGPWYPDERISLREAIASYTQWAPLGLPTRPVRGRLHRNFPADIIALSTVDGTFRILCSTT